MSVTGVTAWPIGHAAYCVASLFAHELGVGARQGADARGDLRLIDAIRAARDHEHGRVVLAASKENRLGDLHDRAAEPGCGFRRGFARFGQHHDVVRMAALLQQKLDTARGIG